MPAELDELRALIDDMNIEDQRRVTDAAEYLRTVVDQFGEHGQIAFALVGAEIAATET